MRQLRKSMYLHKLTIQRKAINLSGMGYAIMQIIAPQYERTRNHAILFTLNKAIMQASPLRLRILPAEPRNTHEYLNAYWRC
jgi:hypothetical protein